MSNTNRITGAQALIRALEHEQVDTVFGLPGGCILPAYDPLLESSIRHVLVRHEQGAGHMAEGYAPVCNASGCVSVNASLTRSQRKPTTSPWTWSSPTTQVCKRPTTVADSSSMSTTTTAAALGLVVLIR